MAFVTCREMKQIEEQAFAANLDQEKVLVEAGSKVGNAILKLYPNFGHAVAFIGKGHNAGDALVALEVLQEAGWKVAVYSAYGLAELTEITQNQFKRINPDVIESIEDINSQFRFPFVAIDGLLGIGAEGSLREPLKKLASYMNNARKEGQSITVSVDIPSGVDADSGEVYPDAVVADATATIAMPKQGLIADQAVNNVGRIELISMPCLATVDASSDHLITPYDLDKSFLRLPFDRHKGDAGRVGIIAGSRGMYGAAELCSYGSLKAGAGLVTLYTLESDYPILATRLPAEVMVKPIQNYSEIIADRLDALIIGPGWVIPEEQKEGLENVLNEHDYPLIIDAGALDYLVVSKLLEVHAERCLCSPHPGELRRILGDLKGTRRAQLKQFLSHYDTVLLYKGTRTLVGARESPVAYNTTGTPGMASGGQGDTLSGVLGALVAQGVNLYEAAKLGAWLCGRASEMAVAELGSPHSLTASNTANFLSKALEELAVS